MINNIIVSAENDDLIPEAKQLARELGLEFAELNDADTEYALIVSPRHLGIQKLSEKRFAPYYIDMLSGTMQYRSAHAGRKKELLARAIGLKPKDHPTIIDATAGLGRDSFILATLGFNVTLLERSPIVFALLRDAMRRAAEDPHTHDIINRMQLINTDAITWLERQTSKPEVIYLDPMFPKRDKSALVKKEMIILQHLAGQDTDADQLFNAALACAGKRVVVKRSRLAPTIVDMAPTYMLKGTSSRFDIYTV